jgi:hypothetical protein
MSAQRSRSPKSPDEIITTSSSSNPFMNPMEIQNNLRKVSFQLPKKSAMASQRVFRKSVTIDPHANTRNSPIKSIKLNISAVDDIDMNGLKVIFSGLIVLGRRR